MNLGYHLKALKVNTVLLIFRTMDWQNLMVLNHTKWNSTIRKQSLKLKIGNSFRSCKTIRDLGYGVTTNKEIIPVLQMTCASCAISVESMLKSQAGVVNASVN